MSIGSRIKECREKIGLTQTELAEILGVSKGAIGNYEAGIGYPKIENMRKLFEVLHTDANYLFQDEVIINNDTFSESEKVQIKKYRKLDLHGKKVVDFVLNEEYDRCQSTTNDEPQTFLFRRLHKNKASAGCGYDLANSDEWREITVIDTPAAREADFAVEIDGNSMEPTYYDGDIVYISIDPNVPKGSIGLFTQNGCGYIKEAGKNRLISHNPDFDDIYPKDGEIKNIGRVIGIAEFP